MKRRAALVLTVLAALAAGCGGSGSAGAPAPTPADATLQQRIAAASATAAGHAECVAVRPFYWEIGDATGRVAGASVSTPGAADVTADTTLGIASASKWLYSTWYLEAKSGQIDDTDRRFLRFQSGWTDFTSCSPTQTVEECADTRAVYTGDTRFAYGGGHMQVHAAQRGGLGPDRDAQLAQDIGARLGVALQYAQPQLAGGARTSAAEYAGFLRAVLAGRLRMGALLGADAICASKQACPSQVASSPAPHGEPWSYALGHWVESDVPGTVQDGAYSSPGLFGFYPWIDKTRTWYGIVSRYDPGGAIDSVDCGRVIRRAWIEGRAP